MDFARPEPIKTINRLSPPYPATIIAFSKNPGNNAFDVLRFSDDVTFNHYRVMTVAAIRVLMHDDDLTDVPTGVLTKIHKLIFPDARPVTERAELLTTLSLDAIRGVAIPYEDTMSDETAGTATTATNSTEAKAEAKKQAKIAADEAKAKAKKEREEKRADGVIGNIFAGLNTKEGTTVEEMLDKLVAKFPTRTRDGMSSTVKIQFSRLAKSKNREIINANIVGRGRVYKFADLGAVPGEVVVKEVAKPAAAAAPAAPASAQEAADVTANAASQTASTEAAKPAAKSAKRAR